MQRKGFKFKTIVIPPRESPRLGAMRIMYYLKVLQRDCVHRVMGGRKKGGKEKGMNYQRENVNKILQVAVAVSTGQRSWHLPVVVYPLRS